MRFLLYGDICCSVAKSRPILCDPMDCNTPGSSVLHYFSGVCSKLYPLSQRCCLTISVSVTPFSFCLQSFPDSGSFPVHQLLHQVAKVLELQHQSFQWILRADFLQDWFIWSPCSPQDSQESSPAPQFKTIDSSVLNLLYSLTLTSVHTTGKP